MRSCALSAGGGREGGGSAHPPATFSVPASGADGAEGWNAAPRAACGMRMGWGEMRRSPFRFVSGPAGPLLFLVLLLCSFLLRSVQSLLTFLCFWWAVVPSNPRTAFPAACVVISLRASWLQKASVSVRAMCMAGGLKGFFTSSFWADHVS